MLLIKLPYMKFSKRVKIEPYIDSLNKITGKINVNIVFSVSKKEFLSLYCVDRGKLIMNLSEWVEEGVKIYGPDYLDWKFRCPNCDRVQSAGSIVKEVQENNFSPKRKVFTGNGLPCVYQECTGHNCDYVSYQEKDRDIVPGLIKLTGETEDKKETSMFVFNFADKE